MDPRSFKLPKEIESSAKLRRVDGQKRDTDVEKVYSTSEFVAKLRRLADALEAGERFEIQVAGERIYVPARAEFNVEHERDGGEEESIRAQMDQLLHFLVSVSSTPSDRKREGSQGS